MIFAVTNLSLSSLILHQIRSCKARARTVRSQVQCCHELTSHLILQPPNSNINPRADPKCVQTWLLGLAYSLLSPLRTRFIALSFLCSISKLT